MEQWKLPDGWHWLVLGEECKTTSGGTPSRNRSDYFAGNIPWVKSGELNDDIVLEVEERITEEAIQNSSAKIFPKGTLLIALYGATVGKLGILGMDAATNQAVCAIFPSSKIDTKYLFWFLRTQRQELIRASIGGAQPNISQAVIRGISFPLPFPNDPVRSLETQRRVVLRLETLLGEVKSARELQESIEEDTSQLLTSVLWSIFPDPEKDMPAGWQVKTVEEISDNPQYGYTQSATQEPVGPKFLRITDIQDGQVDWANVPYCQIETRALERYRLKDNDLVFARTGATTGKTFLIKSPPEAVFASYLIRLRIVEGALPEFIYWYFQSPYYWKQITPRGGAMPNMNAQLLKQVRVSIPTSIDSQRSIIDKIELYADEVRSLKSGQNESFELITQLEQSLLAQAFRGEL